MIWHSIDLPNGPLPEPPAEATEVTPEPLSSSPESDTSNPEAPIAPAATEVASLPARRVVVSGIISSIRSISRSFSAEAARQRAESPAATPEEAEAASEESSLDETGVIATEADNDAPPPDATSAPSTDWTTSPAAQAVLIARVLAVAAASTAAYLMPNEIIIDGQVVMPFPGMTSLGGPIQPVQAPETPQQRRRAASLLPFSRTPTTPTSDSPSSQGRFSRLFNRRASSPPASPGLPAAAEANEEDADATAFVVPRPSLMDSPVPSSESAMGSFEYVFLGPSGPYSYFAQTVFERFADGPGRRYPAGELRSGSG
jgi:hypothetical protein